ncbi:hypothetical protein FA707_05385 [Vagococcus zengguangii]|uniref:Uncharacterized protein n=1 Tax=Vagococcus zengguangii TaxID=2571750 RepID=A0A4D7CTZ1_9ENTE|nr:hypothetical protein FA707_05385 [Vagococcus zengguangii]
MTECFFIAIILFVIREWMGSGVPSGLQNQYEELRASWVGSIPTLSRHKNIRMKLSNSFFNNRDVYHQLKSEGETLHFFLFQFMIIMVRFLLIK